MDIETLPETSKCRRKETHVSVFPAKSNATRITSCSQAWIVFFALLVSVVCLCGSLLLNFSLLTKYGKLSEEVERQGHLIEKVVGDQMSNIALQTQAVESFQIPHDKARFKRKSPKKRTSRKHRKRRCKKRRPRRNINDHPKPVTHLSGQFNNVSHAVHHGNYFTWQSPHLVFRSSFRYLDTGGDNSVYGIEIRQSGLYVIYSQLAVHGTRRGNIHKTDCSHETVRLTFRNGVPQSHVLLKSLLTQDDRGRGHFEDDGVRHFPLDTAMQMGVFALKHHDHILIRRPEQCTHMEYQMDHRYTYFGAFMLHPIP